MMLDGARIMATARAGAHITTIDHEANDLRVPVHRMRNHIHMLNI